MQDPCLSSDVLKIQEVSAYLKIKVSGLYSLVEERKIPHYRIGRQIRFKKSDIDIWMEGQRQGVVDVRVEARKILRSVQKKADLNVDRIVKKTIIDEVKGKRYNSDHGKPDQSRGLRKEVKDGTL